MIAATRKTPFLASLLLPLFLLLPELSSSAWAQTKNSENTLRLDAGASSPAAKIEELSWLAGYWRGEGMGGEGEEIWSRPTGDRMLGVFGLRQNGQLVFSEAMTIVQHEGSLVLKIKHFGPDFIGWEAKDESMDFPLVRLGENEAFFSGLTLRRRGDVLDAFVVVEEGEQTREFAIRFKRLPL